MLEPLKTRVFQCIFEWNIKVLTAAAEIFPLNSFFPTLCEAQRLSSQIYSCLKSFFMSSLNWLTCETTGYVNAKHKIWTLSNSGIKMGIWGLWPWCQNSSVDFQPSPLQSNIFLMSSWNCSVSSATSGRLSADVIRRPLHRCLHEVTHASMEPENIRSMGEPPEAPWHGWFDFDAIAAWLQASLDCSRRRWQMRCHDVGAHVCLVQIDLLRPHLNLPDSLWKHVWMMRNCGCLPAASRCE